MDILLHDSVRFWKWCFSGGLSSWFGVVGIIVECVWKMGDIHIVGNTRWNLQKYELNIMFANLKICADGGKLVWNNIGLRFWFPTSSIKFPTRNKTHTWKNKYLI